jgi:hypothetical protein
MKNKEFEQGNIFHSKEKMMHKFTKYWFFSFIFIILFISCVPKPSEKRVHGILEVILKDDLTVIVEGIDSNAVLQPPFYEVREFSKYKEGQYQYLAVVDFYFLKEIKQKIVRKYRFDKWYLRWERYYNEYESY